MADKIFLGLGILTLFSGIYLVTQQDYVIGASGSIVGAGLILQNIKKIRNENHPF